LIHLGETFLAGPHPLRGDQRLRLIVWSLALFVLVAFAAIYISRAFAPPRTGYDVHEYVKIAKAIDAGQSYNNHQWPIGYPIVLVCFWRAGIHGNPGLVLFNLLCLSAGLGITIAMGRRFLSLTSLELACLCGWTLASRVTLDLATIWQPEMPFLLMTMLGVWCLWRAVERMGASVAWLWAGVICTVVSISLRNIGIALIPATLWTGAVVSRDWASVRRILLLVAIAAVTCGAALVFINFGLFREASGPDAQPPRAVYHATGYVSGILETIDTRWEEASEIVANAGYSAGWPPRARPAGFCLGLAFVLATALGVWKHRRSPAAIYLAAYFSILAVWPYYMPRFWAPVLPLLACFAWIGCKTFAARFQWPASTRQSLVTAYCLLFVALGFSTIYIEFRERHSIEKTPQVSNGANDDATLLNGEISRRHAVHARCDDPRLAAVIAGARL
jgi:4-amino-4-deoxy-L-arabinose transferase-like glycosyltransferase